MARNIVKKVLKLTSMKYCESANLGCAAGVHMNHAVVSRVQEK